MSKIVRVLELLRDILDTDVDTESPSKDIVINDSIGVNQSVFDQKVPIIKYQGMFKPK